MKAILISLCLTILSCPSFVLSQDLKQAFKVPDDPRRLFATALIETTKGPIEIEFFREEATATVANFQYLISKNFYNNLLFHKLTPGYVIEGGDPTGTGKGHPGYFLVPEFSNIEHQEGTMGMSRRADPVNAERLSNGSQFYITLKRAKHLDGLYTAFARVRNGMENLRRLRQGDRIIKILLPRREGS